MVDALNFLFVQVANDSHAPAVMLRELTVDGQEGLKNLNRKYGHLGCEKEGWYAYRARDDIGGFWEYDLEEKMVRPAACLAVGRAKDWYLRKILACSPANFTLVS